MISVVSYNILAPELVKSHYIDRKVDDLDTDKRLSLVQQELSDMINSDSPIFGLQEVSKTWAQKLFVFFNNKGYSFYWAKGHSIFNGFMGTALAWPNSLKLVNLEVVTPGKSIPLEQSLKKGYFTEWRSILQKIQWFNPSPPEVCESEMARSKKNETIIATFEDFVIGTYHMPCEYKFPTVMKLHATAISQILIQKAEGRPIALIGDFNMKPESPEYNCIIRDFNDAYAQERPAFTNRARFQYETMTSPVDFEGVIDYIFTRGFETINLKPVKTLEQLPEPKFLPTTGVPSDHLPIGATLEIKSYKVASVTRNK